MNKHSYKYSTMKENYGFVLFHEGKKHVYL